MLPLLRIAAALFVVFGSAQSMAETHALIVGIDAYAHVRQLKGAVADARDITAALKHRGVRDVTTILDLAATRDRVLAQLDQMTDRVQRDDLVIIAFAGHGSQETWGKVHPPGVREGDLHEVFLLADINLPTSDGIVDPRLGGSARERIAGSEMNIRLRTLEAKGARTIFVSDTCFGGGMARQPLFKTNIPEISYRSLPPFHYGDGQDPLADVFAALPATVDTDTAFPSLTFLAAVDPLHRAPEISIPRGATTKRGALSFAFARIIEGTTPISRSGIVTRGELVDYINATVRTYSENAQDPDLRPRANFDRAVIDVARDLSVGMSAPDNAAVSRTVKIAVVGGEPVVASSGPEGLFDMRPATSRDDADLVFDLQGHSVYSTTGELVAVDVMLPTQLAGIAEREVALRRLMALSRPRPREIRLENGDKRYVLHDKVVVDARKLNPNTIEAEYYLLFDIAGTGVVQFLYPFKGDPAILPRGRPFQGIEALPPFGADTLVLIVSSKPLEPLIAELRRLDGRVAALDAVNLVEKALNEDMRIGLQGIFTAPGTSVAGP